MGRLGRLSLILGQGLNTVTSVFKRKDRQGKISDVRQEGIVTPEAEMK